MKTIGNILWFFIAGIGSAIGWLLWAAILAITIVGLPFARQCLKLARLTLWPFGRTVIKSPDAATLGTVGNILWFIPGLLMSLLYALAGVLLCITIIGIPFGLQSFKFISLALAPFGKEVIRTKDVTAGMAVALEAESA